MALDVDGIIEQLKGATILELNDLVKSIEDEFGVSAAAPVAAAGAAGGDTAEVKDSFDVELTEAGQEKVKVIKAIKEITGQGLKESKGLADKAPSIIKEGATEEEANKIKEQLEAVGATVTLK
ncbi:MAG: 50S ribosomal protein L7/L12 [Bombilactobacillus mellifer]|nr:50S ribosomal protein L7/L12 [Bombilactobacillus mellifer]